MELYAAGKKTALAFSVRKDSLNLEDYCFAGPRKAAPWYASLSEARSAIQCKRMVFGLEICADHAANRLAAINTSPNRIEVDIHLVPSAGMRPVYIAARKFGFIVNCDGWNQPPKRGGRTLDVGFEAGVEGVEKLALTPHSVVGQWDKDISTFQAQWKIEDELEKKRQEEQEEQWKLDPTVDADTKNIQRLAWREEGAVRIEGRALAEVEFLTPTSEAANADKSKVIFGKGPGEIHYYPLKDLPK